MIEESFSLLFFLKKSKKKMQGTSRFVYLRITVDGIPKESYGRYLYFDYTTLLLLGFK